MATATKTRRSPRKAQSTKERADAYQVITDQVIELLEAGTVPWHRPWNADCGMPRSLATGKLYRGVNVFVLALTAQARGYSSPWWLTANAAFKRGATFKGERGDAIRKGTQVVYWSFFDTTDKVTKEPVRIPSLKIFTVFNVEQFDNVGDLPVLEQRTEHERIEACDEIIAAYFAGPGPELRHGGADAYYHPVADYIQMPELETFEGSEEYYGALFHEAAHSTGHGSRLKREGIADLPAGHRFGDELYSREELVAEMTSAFLSGLTGISAAVVGNSASYIQNWLNALRNDKKLLEKAAREAQKAAEFIVTAGVSAKPADETEAADAA